MDSVAVMVVLIVLFSLIFGTINNAIKRKYSQPRVVKGAVGDDQATSALLEIEKMKQKERAESRAMFERLAHEKMDVVKTAITMGYGDIELKELDRRLENLVGADKLNQLLDEAPSVKLKDADLMDDDLAAEIDRLSKSKQK